LATRQRSIEAGFRERWYNLFLPLVTGESAFALMTVALGTGMHLPCHFSPVVGKRWYEQDLPVFGRHSFMRVPRHCSDRDVANCRNAGQSNEAVVFLSSTLKPGPLFALREGDSDSQHARLKDGSSMLRIERSANGEVVFTLSGRMQAEDIEQFQQVLIAEVPGSQLLFDFRDVTLVNQDAVTFLAGCEAKGIKLENCPHYIRNWINQEKRQHKRRRRPTDPK
jgi:hypothetical protein